jgi:glycosyltransferase involved in cell wall biosynthesis
MKILFLCRLYSPHIGGVEKHVAKISKNMLEDGNEITIITENYDKKLKNFEKINGVNVYRINTGREDSFRKFRIWKELFIIRKLIINADIVHCHDVFFWYLPFRFIYANKPVYTTFHGYESYPINKKAVLIRKLSEKLSWGNICIGDFIQKWYGTTPGFVSYGAVDIPKSNIQKVRNKKNTAVFIGRVDDQTGVLTYTKAVEILQKKIPNFEITIIGDGKYRRLVQEKFNVLGFQKQPEKYFPNFHFAFVSRYLSILEAFAAKKLVFAVYDNPVKEDYLKMAPFAKFLVIEKDPEKLAKKIIYYLEHDREVNRIIEEEFHYVKEQTWDKVVKIYYKLWSKK